nr:hypothetical protein pKpNDM1_00373 [Raoultella planticola]QJS00498.1 hypothetical protein [Klebsiella quasipneumoniae]UFD96838.1 hypothetical protein [Klebsiella oxytoca]UVN19627.1 hypothetical protein [Klebsiella michiganensis]UWX38467.1 hypothetical protein KK467_p0795 [Klebsiella pneumoniae]
MMSQYIFIVICECLYYKFHGMPKTFRKHLGNVFCFCFK